MEIYDIAWIEWDTSGQYAIGIEKDGVRNSGGFYIDSDCIVTITKENHIIKMVIS